MPTLRPTTTNISYFLHFSNNSLSFLQHHSSYSLLFVAIHHWPFTLHTSLSCSPGGWSCLGAAFFSIFFGIFFKKIWWGVGGCVSLRSAFEIGRASSLSSWQSGAKPVFRGQGAEKKFRKKFGRNDKVSYLCAPFWNRGWLVGPPRSLKVWKQQRCMSDHTGLR